MCSAILALFAVAQPAAASETLRIFAAASLTDALSDVLESFERAHPGVHVVPQFGGSSDLARQILAGAPADLFFSADVRQLDRIAADIAIKDDARKDVLSNQLVIVRNGEHGPLSSPSDVVDFERIAMADPQVVPAGVYAREYFESLSLWSELLSKIVPTLDVRGALAAVATGQVDVGVVYRTDAAIEPRVSIVHAVPRKEGPEIVYSLAMVVDASEQERRTRPLVQELFAFLSSQEAAAVFEGHGFVVLAREH